MPPPKRGRITITTHKVVSSLFLLLSCIHDCFLLLILSASSSLFFSFYALYEKISIPTTLFSTLLTTPWISHFLIPPQSANHTYIHTSRCSPRYGSRNERLTKYWLLSYAKTWDLEKNWKHKTVHDTTRHNMPRLVIYGRINSVAISCDRNCSTFPRLTVTELNGDIRHTPSPHFMNKSRFYFFSLEASYTYIH